MFAVPAAFIYAGAIKLHVPALRWTAALLVGPDQVRRWDEGERDVLD